MKTRNAKRLMSFLLAVCMILTGIPTTAFAETTAADPMASAMTEAKTFIDNLTVNSSANEPETVVSTWKQQFTWDHEQRESKNKSYLFEWSYYNGVVFEGLDYIYDITADTAYSRYVEKYLGTMINEKGAWTTCSNNTSKQCAGYVSTHGVDCYKTASLLLDYYELTGQDRYYTMANTLYNDLKKAQTSYTSDSRGGNYNHTWGSSSTYAVWLDGLYMVQPFMAEFAAYTNDTEELNKIAERFAWVSENMYDEATGLFYHAANSKDNYYNNNGKYWGRAIGWYAAALVDVMDYMEGENLAAMTAQLKKLVDGMLPYQTEDGMWRQYVNTASSTKETSVTALMAYAIQKAVNSGWLEESYAQYAENAFIGMCEYALDASGLHYICHKGSTSSYSEPSYGDYVNEGKGVGPFIMAYAAMKGYGSYNKENVPTPEPTVEVTPEATPEPTPEPTVEVTPEPTVEATPEPTPTPEPEVDKETGITIWGILGKIFDIINKSRDTKVQAALEHISSKFTAYDIILEDYEQGTDVTVAMPIPEGYDPAKVAVYYVSDDGQTTERMNGKVVGDNYEFETNHFSTYAIVEEESVTGNGTITVPEEGNPYEGLDEAAVYPEYPADGAVRIDKTATEVDFENTGVVQVELDVAGVSVRPGIDAVLTIDVSNSMCWATGSSNKEYVDYNKLDEVMEAVKKFSAILLADNEDGTPTENTVTIVTFAGWDAENGTGRTEIDSVRTLVTATSNLDVVNAIADGTKFTKADTIQFRYIPAGSDANKVANVRTTSAESNRGDTNYDYAFWQTEKAITDGNLGGENREIHVLFMTDGCASNFNNTYYRNNGRNYYYQPGTNKVYQAPTTHTTGTSWTNAILTSISQNGGNIYAKNVSKCVDGIYAIGFDMAHGSFSGIGTWDAKVNWEDKFNEIVSKVVTDESGNGLVPVTAASDSTTLNAFYESLARELRYAGTQANVTDIIDSDFDLQLTQITGSERATFHGDLGFKPTITVSAYELWTKSETTDTSLIGTRKVDTDGNYICKVLETVSFNDAGTEAYSSLKGGGTANILVTSEDGTVAIVANYFTYVKTPEGEELFKWHIGNITEDEVVLSFYAYLTGTLEGERPKQLYYTNEEATLEYIDINGDYATKIFPIPAVAWGGASTAYEFYLVNEDGKACDRNGNEIPFANRITITGPYFEELYLNQEDEEVAKEIIAAYVLPAGYTLYDDTAKYTVVTASGTIEGKLTISKPAEGKAQTTILVSATTPSYIQSRVAFGVIYNEIPEEAEFELTPNEVVIDYGKSIIIDTDDKEDLEDGYKATLVGFSRYYSTVDLKHKFSNTSAIDNFSAAYGTFSIENAEKRQVRYTPSAFVNNVDKVFCVLKMTKDSDAYYMVDVLTVIPATNVYYETDFAEKVFTNVTTGEAWSTKTEGAGADNLQDDGTIGVNQTYGYDSSYTNDNLLSNGSSLFVEGAGIKLNDSTAKYTYSQFSFTGTGFDLISRTGEQQGAIRVDIYTNASRTADSRVKSVTVLNKSESKLELYQIPVVSVNDLAYGTYYVTVGVNAAYSNTAYPELSRGGKFYFDAIRIYDPAKGNAEAEAAYVADGESAPIITEVRAQLITAGDYDITTDVEGITFVDSTYTDGNADHTTGSVAVAEYANIGPNNEVYLAKDQGIAFEVSATGNIASIDVAAKAPNSGQSATLAASISATTDNVGTGITKGITSATPQYYNLMEGSAAALTDIFADDGKAYVIIRNTGEGVLSITDIKVAFGDQAGAVTYSVSEDAVTFANTVVNNTSTAEPNYDIISAVFESEKYKLFSTATMTVVTKPEVDHITMRGTFGLNANPTIKSLELDEDGNLVWTIQMKVHILGGRTYTVTGYGKDGTAGASKTDSIRITLF